MARQKFMYTSRVGNAIALVIVWMSQRGNILAIISLLEQQQGTYEWRERRGKVTNNRKYNNVLWSCKPSDKNLRPKCYSNNKMGGGIVCTLGVVGL